MIWRNNDSISLVSIKDHSAFLQNQAVKSPHCQIMQAHIFTLLHLTKQNLSILIITLDSALIFAEIEIYSNFSSVDGDTLLIYFTDFCLLAK